MEQESFLTEGKILTDPGWKAVYLGNRPEKGEGILGSVPKDAAVVCAEVTEEKKETKPPPRFSEATLLSAMENSGKLLDDDELAEAMKRAGIGHPRRHAPRLSRNC